MTVLYQTAFPGSDQNPLSGDFETLSGFYPLQQISNAVAATAPDNDNVARLKTAAASFPNDQYCKVRIAAVGASDGGPIVRASSDNDYYLASGFDGSNVRIYSVVNGSFTYVGIGEGVYSVNADVAIEAQGSTLRAKLSGTQLLSVTDTAISSGQPGIFCYDGTIRLDDLEAGDFSAGGTTYQVDVDFTGAGIVSATKKAAKVFSLSSSGSASVLKTSGKLFVLSSSGAVGVVKKTGKSFALSGSGTTGVLKKAFKVFSVSGSGVPTATAAILLLIVKTFSGVGTVSQTFKSVFGVNSSAFGTSTVSLAKKIGKLFSSTGSASASFVKNVKLTLQHSATATVSLTKKISLAYTRLASATVSYLDAYIAAVQRAASGHGTASLNTSFIPGSGEPVYTIVRNILRAALRLVVRPFVRLTAT